MPTKEELQAFIAENEAAVAEFQARGGKPRPLTSEENRLATTDPEGFEDVLAERQEEVLEGMRLLAQFSTAQEDLAAIEREEAAAKVAEMEAERAALLDQRYENAAEIEAALADLNESLGSFMALNSKISKLDRALSQQDRHRASVGFVALHLKRGLHKVSPQLAKLAGIPFAASKPGGKSLAEHFRPEPDPLD